MPRNNRVAYYSRKLNLRFSKGMSDRLEHLARSRNKPIAHIVRLATAAGLKQIEGEEVVQENSVGLFRGQAARISGLNAPDVRPEQTFDGVISSVAVDEMNDWTYATFVSDGPYNVIIVKLDAAGLLQGDYKLEVQDSENSEWRTVGGAKTT